MNLERILLGAAALVMITTTAACGSSTSNADKTSTALAGNPNTPAAGKTIATGNQKQLTITAKDFSFSADDIDVSKGDTIVMTFKNTGSTTHTLAFYSDDAYKNAIPGADTGNVSAGATKSLTATADVGLYYRCNIHPTQMQGEIEFSP